MINVEHLSFHYTKRSIHSGHEFQCKRGEIFGFLGPSGAGKSTLRKFSWPAPGIWRFCAGKWCVECRKRDRAFSESIECRALSFPPCMKSSAPENLNYCILFTKNKSSNIDELLRFCRSSQMAIKRFPAIPRMKSLICNFIKALLHDPALLCLDEPTSGLDPANSRLMKDRILEEKRKGKTILLTTHNMEDATELCDRVAFIVNGHICALDTPHNLIMSKGAGSITYTWEEHGEQQAVCSMDTISADTKLHKLIAENRLLSIHSSEPTLNDIFLDITGRTLV